MHKHVTILTFILSSTILILVSSRLPLVVKHISQSKPNIGDVDVASLYTSFVNRYEPYLELY